jgi:hypothetical protein
MGNIVVSFVEKKIPLSVNAAPPTTGPKQDSLLPTPFII